MRRRGADQRAVGLDAVASVQLTAQNDCGRLLAVTTFALTSGQWDPTATPTLGQQVTPGATGCWLSLTTLPSTPVSGSMTLLVAQAGLLVVAWDLSLLAPFDPTLTKQNWSAPGIGAALVVNQGDYAHVWVQLLVTPVVTVREGETLDDIAAAAGTTPGVLAALNRLPGTEIVPGQRLLVTRRISPSSVPYWSRVTGVL